MKQESKAVARFETSTSDGNAFLAAIGGGLKHRHVEYRAPFADMDWRVLANWRDVGLHKVPQLSVEVHVGRVPRPRLFELTPQLVVLHNDVPRGELGSPSTSLELQAWLTWYDDLDRYRGDHMMVLLKDGKNIVAVSEASWDARFPNRVLQRLTAVARPWRNRGLAKLAKSLLLYLVQERHGNIEFIMTSNPVVAGPIGHINRQLGFVEHRLTAIYEVGIGEIQNYLAGR